MTAIKYKQTIGKSSHPRGKAVRSHRGTKNPERKDVTASNGINEYVARFVEPTRRSLSDGTK
jgi:hypothetical protein